MASVEVFGRALRRLWRTAPLPASLRALLTRRARRYIVDARTRLLPSAAALPGLSAGSVVVSGFLSESLGVGRGARLTVRALQQAGLPVQGHDVRALLQGEQAGVPALGDGGGGGVWVLHCNPPEAAAVLLNTPPAQWSGRYLIGYWAWELQTLPESWAALARVFHEIWAPSRFVAEAIAPHARLVRVMPHPVDTAAASPPAERIEGQPFRFAVIANARSSLARKNPRGAVEAYRLAFPLPSDRVRLTIKLSNPEADPAGVEALLDAIADRPDIDVVVHELSDAEMSIFLAGVDALISLHRSEGFGLTLAEALALGKPVIATGWSGNLDYMAEHLSEALVPYTLVAPDDPTRRYAQGLWAEPDLRAAAGLIARYVADEAFRHRMIEAGRRCVPAFQRGWAREALSPGLLAHVAQAPHAD